MRTRTPLGCNRENAKMKYTYAIAGKEIIRLKFDYLSQVWWPRAVE